MAGVSKVEVLCPNGRRVNVSVNPNTRLLQVLEECCLKQQLGPSEAFELKHIRRTLDLSLTPVQAGLTNMAKLEVIKSTSQRQSSVVRIGLQVEGGARFQKELDPKTSLTELLGKFEEDNGRGEKLHLSAYRSQNLQPVMNYLSHEVVGDYACEHTTLKKLGITGGSHLLRLRFQEISVEKLNQVKEQIDNDQKRLERLIARAQGPPSALSGTPVSGSMGSETSFVHGSSDTTSVPQTKNDNDSVDMDCSEAMATMDYEDHPDVVRQESETALTEAEARVTETPRVIDIYSGGQARNAHSYEFPIESRQTDIRNWSQPGSARGASLSSFAAVSPFANFKFPEETKGKEVYHNELSVVNRGDFQPCDRQTVVFDLNVSHQETTTVYEDVGEEFFEHTVADIKAWQSARAKELQYLEEQPLIPQSMKRALLEEKITSRYSRAVIRIQFPDRFVLQGLFRPNETVFALYKFAKEHLEDRNLCFELYTTPPKVVLSDQTQTLIDAALAPMSIVYFSSAGKTEGFLASEVLERTSSHIEAQKVLEQHLPNTRSSPGLNAEEVLMQMEPVRDRDLKRVGEAVKSTKGHAAPADKLPKWFQPGKK